MRVVHCGRLSSRADSRAIKPSQDEAERGVVSLNTFTYCCVNPECRGKLYYKQELFEVGQGPVTRIKKNIAAFVARLDLARESHWVWSYHPETFAKVKRTVR